MFFNTSYAWGGLEMFSAELFDLLRASDWDVRFVCRPNTSIDNFLRARGHGDRLIAVNPKRRYLDLSTDGVLRREFRGTGVDIVHTFASGDIPYVAIAMRLLGDRRPSLVHHLQMLPGHSRKDPFHRLTYSALDRVVAITQQIADRARALWPIAPERVVPIYYGLDLAHQDVSDESVHAARERFGLADHGPRIGLVGQVCPIKGQLEVFRAFARVAHEFPNTSLVLAGAAVSTEPGYEAALRAEIQAAGLADRVVLTGFCDAVPALLRSFDVFVLGSHEEPFGRVVIEAMSAGCVTIGTRAGGVPEIIEHGVDGFMYAPRDVNGLTDTLRTALSMPQDDSQRMIDSARKKVADRFGMDRFLREMTNLYEELAAEARA